MTPARIGLCAALAAIVLIAAQDWATADVPGLRTSAATQAEPAQAAGPPDPMEPALETPLALFNRAAGLAEGRHGPPDFDAADRWFQRFVDAFEPGKWNRCDMLLRPPEPVTLYLPHMWDFGEEEHCPHGTLVVAGYYDNVGTDRIRDTAIDSERAAKWYQRAASLGFAAGHMALGHMARIGRGIPKDSGRAAAHYSAAAAIGCPQASLSLGKMYLHGDLGDPDVDMALWLFEQAVAGGNVYAAFAIAGLYQSGEHIPRDLAAAREWHEHAVRLGGPLGSAGMADFYFRSGAELPDSRIDGLAWFFILWGKGPDADTATAAEAARHHRVEPFAPGEIEAARRRVRQYLETFPAARNLEPSPYDAAMVKCQISSLSR